MIRSRIAFFCALALLFAACAPALAGETPEVRLTLIGHSTSITLPDDSALDISVNVTVSGTLSVAWPIAGAPVFETPVEPGRNDLSIVIWEDGMQAPDGDYRLTVTLTAGEAQVRRTITLTLHNDPDNAPPSVWDIEPDAAAAPGLRAFAPVDSGAVASHKSAPGTAAKGETAPTYWSLTMGDLSNEQAIWQSMMQPITVLDDGKHTGKETYKLRRTPDSSAARDNIIGEVTYKSQGVHVLDTTEDGWAHVEVYNTSYGAAYKRNTNRQGYGVTGEKLTGYVPADILKRVTPRDDYALLIDKQNQTMYIFEGGKITGTLLVSTGLNNSQQSWNETPAGEFLIISKTGGFWAGNLYCDMGLLLNNGCLIHEVPSVFYESTGIYDFSTTEPRLGYKASHGCIRVQRKENARGQNMRWLWNHLKVNTRVYIWDDATRYTEYPDDQTVLYYNPVGGSRYHTTPRCSSVNRRYWPLAEFRYGELTLPLFTNLTPCATCGAPTRPETIYKANLKNGFSD